MWFCVRIELYYLSSGAGSPRSKKNSSSIFRQIQPRPIGRVIIPVNCLPETFVMKRWPSRKCIYQEISVGCQTHTSCVGLKTTTFSCSTFHFCPSWCFSPMGPFAFNINDDTEQGQPTSSRPSQVTHLSLNLLRAINYTWLPDEWNQYDIGTQTGLINIIIRLPSPSAGFDLYFFLLHIRCHVETSA